MSAPIWIFGETKNGRIAGETYEVMLRAKDLSKKLKTSTEVFTIADEISKEELCEALRHGANRVVAVVSPKLKNCSVETKANIFSSIIKKYSPQVILAAATTTGRTLMPSVAARLGTGLTADCTELDIDEETKCLLQTRPAIGGNIMATIKTPNHRPQMATVRPHSTLQTEKTDDFDEKNIELVALDEKWIDDRTKFVSFRSIAEEGIDIQKADRIVAGGAGFKKKENFRLLEETASLLGASVGATRDAVDRGWAAYPQQIGLSGKTIVPKLYIGVGISGAIQHIAGMKTAENIVAINHDPEAQLFKIADFGIITDLFEFLPILNEKLRQITTAE